VQGTGDLGSKLTPQIKSEGKNIAMKRQYTILIADRNPHVRAFLKREMEAEGYKVRLARNGSEVLKWVFGCDPLHLVVIDPELPDVNELDILRRLEERIPTLPFIIHGFLLEYNESFALSTAVAFVEKGGKSIERLRTVAVEMLQKANPRHSRMLKGMRLSQGESMNGTEHKNRQ